MIEESAVLKLLTRALAHDVLAPLRAVDTMAGWIEEDLGDALTGAPKENMGLLRGKTQQIAGLLQDLLAYARFERQPRQPAEVDLNHLITTAAAAATRPAGIEISTALDLKRARVADAHLAHVITALVDNAIRHHDLRTGRVIVHAATSEAADGPGYLTLKLSDDGPGIAPIHQGRLFEPLYTVLPKDVAKGSGLGLTLVGELCALNSAQITIASDGRGTQVTLTWPLMTGNSGESQ